MKSLHRACAQKVRTWNVYALRVATLVIAGASTGVMGFSPAVSDQRTVSFDHSMLDRSLLSSSPSSRGRTLQRRGGGGHGGCALGGQTSELLTSIVPKFSGDGLTVDPHPTFWIYVPYSLSSAESIEFLLKDANGQVAYRPTLAKANSQPGVISLRLPDSITLAENQEYSWTFAVNCGEMKLTVEGTVKKISRTPELERDLKAATAPQDRAVVYRKYGLWLDALTVLADRHRAEPNNAAIVSTWTDLLNASEVQLGDIATKPFVR